MKNLSRRTVNGLLASALATPFLASAAGRALAETPAYGGTLRISHVVEPSRLITIDDLVSGEISSKVIEGLLTYDLEFNPQPELATEWSISDDGLEYTFKLRGGVKWHDGADFTSADAAYSLQVLQKSHPRGRSAFAAITEFLTPEPDTLVLKLSRPAPYLLKALVSSETPIFPRHLFEGTDPITNPVRHHPIGTGPFIFKEWEAGSHILLERNPNYWSTSLPYLDRIIFRFIPDSGARAAAFEAGEIDLGGNTPVPPNDLDRLVSANPNLAYQTSGYDFYGYHTQAVLNLRTEPLSKKSVRQAIAHAIDYDTFLQSVWYGKGVLSPTAISPRLKEFHNAALKPYAFDVELAKKLLDEAGYPEKSDGFRFPLRVTFNAYLDNYRRGAEFITQALRKIGIDARLESFDYTTFVSKVYTDAAFDISVEGMINLFDPAIGVQRVYWSKNIKKGVPFSNASAYSNAEVDKLLEQASAEVNPEKRREAYLRFQEIVYEDVPVINLVANDLFTVFDKKVRDHTTVVNGVYGSLAHAYIAPGS